MIVSIDIMFTILIIAPHEFIHFPQSKGKQSIEERLDVSDSTSGINEKLIVSKDELKNMEAINYE